LKGLKLLSLQRKLNSQNAKVAMFARWNVVAVVLVLAIFGVSSAADIFGAVASDRVSELSQMVEENPRLLNKRGPGGQTPLMNAVLSGKTSAVEALLKAGADVTISEKDGYTPMVRNRVQTVECECLLYRWIVRCSMGRAFKAGRTLRNY
jgi:ankyrin repeat protein